MGSIGTALAAAVELVRDLYLQFFSPQAILARIRAVLARRQADEQVAQLRQQAAEKAIDAGPDKTGQALQDDLLKDFGGKP